MSRCPGLSYNGWLYFTSRRVVDELVAAGYLKPCRRHPGKLRMTPALLEAAEVRLEPAGPAADDAGKAEEVPHESG